MKTPDINEEVKDRLAPFLITDWTILPSEDLSSKVNQFNKKENELKVTDVSNILWFAHGLNNSNFFLKDYSLDSKIPGEFNLPTEHLGALVVHIGTKCILSAAWHGYDFIMVDSIKTCFEDYPILRSQVKFGLDIAQVLSIE